MFAPKPFDVAKEMVRVTKPGGRIVMGQLDPERSNFIRIATAKDQRIVYASASGSLHQSRDMGSGWSHRRAIWPGWSAPGENLHGQGHLLLRVARQEPGRSDGNLQTILWPDHERV
jgi:hypothetical protein